MSEAWHFGTLADREFVHCTCDIHYNQVHYNQGGTVLAAALRVVLAGGVDALLAMVLAGRPLCARGPQSGAGPRRAVRRNGRRAAGALRGRHGQPLSWRAQASPTPGPPPPSAQQAAACRRQEAGGDRRTWLQRTQVAPSP